VQKHLEFGWSDKELLLWLFRYLNQTIGSNKKGEAKLEISRKKFTQLPNSSKKKNWYFLGIFIIIISPVMVGYLIYWEIILVTVVWAMFYPSSFAPMPLFIAISLGIIIIFITLKLLIFLWRFAFKIMKKN